jgi:murein DD-endopeptidase / murein LD-carboxypeptidase
MTSLPAIPVAIRIQPPRTAYQDRIATRAMTLLGAPFRLHGRSPETGLDCVGVVAACLFEVGYRFETPNDYRIRGDFEGRAQAFFTDSKFRNVDDGSWMAGDILLLRPGPRHIHFAVLAHVGAVHAHVGLGRVVLTPLPLPYGNITQWRFQGD